MKKRFRLFVALALAAVTAVSLCGCARDEREAALAAYQEGMTLYNRQKQELDTLRQEAEDAAAVVEETIAAVNATVDGESFALIDGRSEYTAEAVLPDGMRVDYWLVDGQRQEGGSSITFSADGCMTVEAVLRPEKRVTCTDALMCLIDEDGNRIGEPFTELCFEDGYTDPRTGKTVDTGTVSLCVYAETDDLTTVDHWIVNGVALDVYSFVLEFNVYDLAEAMDFQPVFAACYIQHEAPDPSALPQYQSVPLPY